MSNTTKPDNLTIEQLSAIQEYAAANGARWKMKLGMLWQTGKDSGLLRQLRNEFGPAWLQNFKLSAHTNSVIVKLTESHKDFHDYDVIGAPYNRICVGHALSKGDTFNAYMDGGRKIGLKWRGSIEQSLSDALSVKPAQVIVRSFIDLSFNDAVLLLNDADKVHTFIGGSFWAGADMARDAVLERMHKAHALEISPVCHIFEHYLAVVTYGERTLYVETRPEQVHRQKIKESLGLN